MENTRLLDEDFIQENKETIHCLALNGASVLFSAAAMAQTEGPQDVSWWVVSQRAIDATAQLYACLAPPEEVYIEAFEGQNKRCQCAEVGGQLFLDWLDAAGNRTTLSNSELVEAKEIKDASIAEGIASCNWVTVEGEAKVASYDIQDGGQPIWYIVPTLNTGCCSGTISPPPVQPAPEPYVFPTGMEDCQSEVWLIDACIDKYGLHQNFYKVIFREEITSSSGYPICNEYTPTYYWETIRGPYIYPSKADFEGFDCRPEYAPPHPDAPEPGSVFNGGNSGLSPVTYTLDVGCSYNQETDDFDKKYTYDVEATNNGILGLARRMDALAWMINNAQLLPYTDCTNEKPVNEGEWRTISFRSDSVSPYGSARLRKRFRYRGQQGFGLGEVVDHWKDFTFQSGPVIVQHAGAGWGTPQVWAATADEGKRVIRHASGEAGIDPDQDGRWIISSSDSARVGVSDTMRVDTKGGYYWITARDGSDGAPIGAKT